jgi:Cu(I)/Ag(I) efflux system membrane fusion protein
MNASIFKKTRIAYVILAASTFMACSEKKQETATTAQDQQTETPAVGREVIKTPDYKAGNAPVKTALAQLLAGYLKVTAALTASDLASAKREAGALVAAVGKVPVATLAGEQQAFATEKVAEVRQSAANMANANDIRVVREHLELLSEATFSLTKAFGTTDQKLYYQHCPMANQDQGGYWLSAQKEIRNPYFGKAMLECGSTEEVLN